MYFCVRTVNEEISQEVCLPAAEAQQVTTDHHFW